MSIFVQQLEGSFSTNSYPQSLPCENKHWLISLPIIWDQVWTWGTLMKVFQNTQGISEKAWFAQGIFDIPTSLKCAQPKHNQWRLKELWPYILLAFHFKKRSQKSPRTPVGTRAHPAPWLRPSFHPFRGNETPSWSLARLSRACCASLHLCSLRRTESECCRVLNKHHTWLFTGLLWAQNKSLDPNPLKLWGIWNLDPDLKLVVGRPSPGFQFGVQLINTSATGFFCLTPPWIRSYCC